MKDFYYILGVNSNSPMPEIREAYRKLSKKFHPDLNHNDSYFESRFKEIQEAYETLTDPLRRKRYDAAFNNASPTPTRPEAYAPTKQKNYPRTTAIDIVFTVVLIAITALFGNYVWKAINSSKLLKATKPVAAVIAVKAMPITHHKHKKHLIDPSVTISIPKAARQNEPVPVKTSSTTTKEPNDTLKKPIAKSQTASVNSHTFNSQTAGHTFKSSSTNDNVNGDLFYSSYLRSNITGVINMHKGDSFNSGIVAVIPANSKVTVLAKGINYYKVRFNNGIGYVPAWTVISK